MKNPATIFDSMFAVLICERCQAVLCVTGSSPAQLRQDIDRNGWQQSGSQRFASGTRKRPARHKELSMLNRRSFLQSFLATVPGLSIPASIAEESEPPPYSLNGYERMIAMRPDSLDILGRPRSWSLVRDGFHPISPERVIVLTEKSGDGRGRQESAMQQYLNEHFDVHPGKLELILRLMRVMTDYYQAPHLFRDWVIGLAKREALAPTGIGYGFGLLHQFQNDGFVQLMNSPVDWWLFLFPGGAEWQSWEPVHPMIGHVFAPQSPFLQLPVWQLTVSVGLWMDSDSWSWVG